MRAVDTNVLVRILVQDDPDQMAAAERFVSRGAWVSHVVLAEAVWVLEITYGRTRHQIATIVEGLLSHGDLAIQDPEVVHDALANFRKASWTTKLLGEDVKGRYADLKQAAADRCPRLLGTFVKAPEVQYHHDVYNQFLWNLF